MDITPSGSTNLASPGPIGGTTPSSGAFTTLSATGVSSFADGTASAPSVAFTSAATIGLWKRAAGVTNWANGSGGLQFGSNATVGSISGMTNDGLTTAWSIIDGTTTSFSTSGGRNISIAPSGGSVILGTATGTVDIGAAATALKRLYVDYTNTGTVGAVTISKASGRVNIAAAGTSVVVTNTLCTAAAHVFVNIQNTDATAKSAVAVSAAGSFTITLNAACTAQVAIDFFIVNAD